MKSVNLFHGGVPDKQAGKYSGGIKRKLSVAISLIGDPKVRLGSHLFMLLRFFIFDMFSQDNATYCTHCVLQIPVYL